MIGQGMTDARAAANVALDVALDQQLIECRDDGVARYAKVRCERAGRRKPKAAQEAARKNPVAQCPVDLARQRLPRPGIERDQNRQSLWRTPSRHAADDV